MSDILEDQKIHYIVKDYRRMFNRQQEYIKVLKECRDLLEKKDKRIKELESQLENLKNNPPVLKPPKAVKSLLNDTEAQIYAAINMLSKRSEQLSKTANNVSKLRELLNQ